MKASTLPVLVIAACLGGCQSQPAATTSQPGTPAEAKQEATPAAPAAAPEPPPPANPVEAAPAANAETMTIAEMQKRLTELGYHPGPVDGVAGKRTIDALKQFQRAHHLPATGVLDSETIHGLQSAKR